MIIFKVVFITNYEVGHNQYLKSIYNGQILVPSQNSLDGPGEPCGGHVPLRCQPKGRTLARDSPRPAYRLVYIFLAQGPPKSPTVVGAIKP